MDLPTAVRFDGRAGSRGSQFLSIPPLTIFESQRGVRPPRRSVCHMTSSLCLGHMRLNQPHSTKLMAGEGLMS